jgi:hypothetical protein
MGGKWFANKGQILQAFAAVVSACVAIVSLYFVLKSNNSLPKASAVLYVSAAVFFLLLGVLIGRRLERASLVPPVATPAPEANIHDSGTATATGGGATVSGANVTQHLHFPVMPPALPATSQSSERKLEPVDVEFSPSEGQSDKMYLTITNRGPRQSFQAQCRILARRNDSNPPILRTYDLQWEYGGMALSLMPGQSGNLLIASADEDRATDMEWMKLEAAVGQQPTESRWLRGTKTRPEYDLEIKIIGQQSDRPQSHRFTLRAGSIRALEMFQRYVEITDPRNDDEVGYRHVVRGFAGPANASVQVWVHVSNWWHHQGNVTAARNAWSLNCWFGRETEAQGVFEIIAIADGDIESKHFDRLPEAGVRSAIVKVRRTR